MKLPWTTLAILLAAIGLPMVAVNTHIVRVPISQVSYDLWPACDSNPAETPERATGWLASSAATVEQLSIPMCKLIPWLDASHRVDSAATWFTRLATDSLIGIAQQYEAQPAIVKPLVQAVSHPAQTVQPTLTGSLEDQIATHRRNDEGRSHEPVRQMFSARIERVGKTDSPNNEPHPDLGHFFYDATLTSLPEAAKASVAPERAVRAAAMQLNSTPNGRPKTSRSVQIQFGRRLRLGHALRGRIRRY